MRAFSAARAIALVLVLVDAPAICAAQYIDPVCPAWQEVEANGCRTRPWVFVAGAAACGVPSVALVALVLVGRRGWARRGERS